jgi:phage repressor protein C with HTH and peptisase S24 domain
MWEIIPENLVAAMDRAGMNQSQLADAVGMKQPSIGRLISGETKTTRSLDLIANVLQTTPAFLKGETDSPEAKALGDNRLSFRGAPLERNPDLVELDEIDMRFGLGGTYLDSAGTASKRQFSRTWLRNFTTASPENLFWTMGDGDSMEPTIRSGEVILIDRSQISPRMGDGIWAIAFGEIGMIKRLRPMPDGTVQIHSDNQLVRPEVAADGELHVIGRVVAVVRKL